MTDTTNGDLAQIPAGSTNGTPLMTRGRYTRIHGILIELGASDTVTYTIAQAQPQSAPSVTLTRSGAEMRRVDEPLGPDAMIYVTALTGTPKFRGY